MPEVREGKGTCKSATSIALWAWVARGFQFVDPHVFILTVQTWSLDAFL